ncbi:MAG: hypothetical protein M1819_004399 [Sarea resinae]|nr:MAG: hypothetical protein M1819_004399 [Sarea resinae]
MDDSIEANVSTFAAEMRETAFILRNVEKRSMIIIDELGRGTSSRDGLAISLAVAEALVESRALVWFATHFRDLATIMAEKNGVVNLHLAVEMTGPPHAAMTMLYKIQSGLVTQAHYGLALARTVALPGPILETATTVSATLTRRAAARKKNSAAFKVARRRVLVLNLREMLTQASEGGMRGRVLARWLRRLQEEFVVRMEAIDREGESQGRRDADGDGDGDEDEEGEEVIESRSRTRSARDDEMDIQDDHNDNDDREI